jgi:hypothetical protein
MYVLAFPHGANGCTRLSRPVANGSEGNLRALERTVRLARCHVDVIKLSTLPAISPLDAPTNSSPARPSTPTTVLLLVCSAPRPVHHRPTPANKPWSLRRPPLFAVSRHSCLFLFYLACFSSSYLTPILPSCFPASTLSCAPHCSLALICKKKELPVGEPISAAHLPPRLPRLPRRCRRRYPRRTTRACPIRLPPPTCAPRWYTNMAAATRLLRRLHARRREQLPAASATPRPSSMTRSVIDATIETGAPDTPQTLRVTRV